MSPVPLAPTYKTRLNVRPINHAYFVQDDDMESVVRAMRLSFTQWGGIRDLIFPLQPDGGMASIMDYLLELHEPDVSSTTLAAARTANPRPSTRC